MLKSFLLFFAVALLAIACLPLQGRSAQQSAPAPALTQPQTVAPQAAGASRNPVKPTPESQSKAKTRYTIDCAMCHGDNGNGKTDLATSMGLTLGDWTNPATLTSKEDSELFNVIRNGKDKMPSEPAGRADDNQVWNLIIYIRSLSKPGAPAPAAPAQ
jgi:mono/diheme cytochrome c family protein